MGWGAEKTAVTPAPVAGKMEYIKTPVISFEWSGTLYHIYRHPMLFVSVEVKAWFKSYLASDYTRKRDYLDGSGLWFDALNIYKTALEKYKKKGK